MFLPRLRRPALGAAALATAWLLTACGGDDDSFQARNCVANAGPGSLRGLSLYGQASYSNLGSTASTSGTVMLDPGQISFNNTNLPSNAATGSLRAAFYAVPGDYTGGGLSGYLIARYSIQFTGGDDFLLNGQSSNLATQTLNAVTPPRGSYCLVVSLEEYDPASCSSNSDGYCIVDWQEFPSSAAFY